MESLKSHPQYSAALQICQILRSHGFEALFAGGCVRDGLLGRTPHDIDVATSARPERVESIFEKTLALGKSFGVIQVQLLGTSVEVASFRKDGLYIDGRRPESVQFSTAEEDAERRDFTINALFFDPISEQIFDYVGGQKDLANKTLQAVGVAEERFREDHLRLLRAIRFQAQLQFEFSSTTEAALYSCASLVQSVSGERALKEFDLLLQAKGALRAVELLLKTKMLGFLLNLQCDLSLPLKKQQSFYQLNPWLALIRELEIRGETGVLALFAERFKFSRARILRLEKNLWIYQQANRLEAFSWGQLMEKYFDGEVRQGVIFFRLENEGLHIELFESLESCYQQCGGVRPVPVKNAKDFPNVSGEALGKSLRESFWQQLEALRTGRLG